MIIVVSLNLARGSFICHLATEHGKLLDVMRNDKEVDMTEVIDFLGANDNAFKKFIDEGTVTPFDDDLFIMRESIYWK